MMNKAIEQRVILVNGATMPRLGLGTWPMDDEQATTTVAEAIRVGYRLFDTAEAYGNEVGVGAGVRASGIDREEVFLTTKFNGKWHGESEVEQAFINSSDRLGVEYIDLLLIHWPLPAQDRYVDAWNGLVKLLHDGRVRAIGTSNFKPAHMDRIIDATGVVPDVNQIQLNPVLGRADVRAYDEQHGIVTESWAPIGKGGDLLAHPTIGAIATRHAKTVAQVVLRWHLELGLAAVPKTASPERLRENLDVFDFSLSPDEIEAISALDQGSEVAVDSDTFGH
jgi:2,5-diketo-D-gluconate reductase A